MKDKELLSELVKNSFKGKVIDSVEVIEIANRLSRPQLRKYIKLLKRYIAMNTVIVETAFPVQNSVKKEIEDKYSDKIVEYKINKELIVGTKIYDNDIIYSRNLRDKLQDIEKYINN